MSERHVNSICCLKYNFYSTVRFDNKDIVSAVSMVLTYLPNSNRYSLLRVDVRCWMANSFLQLNESKTVSHSLVLKSQNS